MGGRNTARRNNTNLDLKLVTADKLQPKTVHLLYRRSIRLLLQFFVAYYGLCPILKSGKSVGYYTTQYSFKAIRFSDSAQSTLNTATSRKSTRRDSLTGWTIDSIEEYYEPIAKDEKIKMEKFGKAAELGTGNFWHGLQSSEQAKGLRVRLKENTVRDEP